MFTGLIQSTGTLKACTEHRLEVLYAHPDRHPAFDDLELGDSVAVDGVCLTVTDIMAHGFIADISPETLARTTLAMSSELGNLVNLETSLRLGGKLGGHLVTGHIDGMGYLESAIATATSWQMQFQVPDPAISRYIILKGSIAINGVSLTIANCNGEGTWLTVAVIPHTYSFTNLHTLKPGQVVNLEADLLGKYVAKLLSSPTDAMQSSALYADNQSRIAIDPVFLAEHGYM